MAGPQDTGTQQVVANENTPSDAFFGYPEADVRLMQRWRQEHNNPNDVDAMSDSQRAIFDDMVDVGLVQGYPQSALGRVSDNVQVGLTNTLAEYQTRFPTFGSPTADMAQGVAETVYNQVLYPTALMGNFGKQVVDTAIQSLPTRTGMSFVDNWKRNMQDYAKFAGNWSYRPRSIIGTVLNGTIDNALNTYVKATEAIARPIADFVTGGPFLTEQAEELGMNPDDYARDATRLGSLVQEIARMQDAGVAVPDEMFAEVGTLRETLMPDGMELAQANPDYAPAMMLLSTSLQLAPDLVMSGRLAASRTAAVSRARQRMRDMGFDPDQLPLERLQALQDPNNPALRQVSPNTVSGENLGAFNPRNPQSMTLQGQVQRVAGEQSRWVDQAFDRARESEAYVDTLEMRSLNQWLIEENNKPDARYRVSEETTPKTYQAQRELEEMSRTADFELIDGNVPGETLPVPADAVAKPFTDVNRVWGLRQRMNADIRRYEIEQQNGQINATGLEDLEALKNTRRVLDEFLDMSFAKDLIYGDVDNLAKWRRANQYQEALGEKLENNQFIGKLLGQDLTGEEVRAFIFNMGDATNKANAARAVQSIQELFGADSPQMQLLKNDIMFSMIEPLLRPSGANYNLYADRFRTYFQKNDTMMRQLFGDDGMDQLQNFHKVVLSDMKVVGSYPDTAGFRGASGQIINPSDKQNIFNAAAILVAGKLPGSGNVALAAGGAKIRFIKSLLQKMTGIRMNEPGTNGMNAHQLFMREYLGQDMRVSFTDVGFGIRGDGIGVLNPVNAAPIPGQAPAFISRLEAAQQRGQISDDEFFTRAMQIMAARATQEADPDRYPAPEMDQRTQQLLTDRL